MTAAGFGFALHADFELVASRQEVSDPPYNSYSQPDPNPNPNPNEVTYTADKVVLAAGIFGTFSLLVDSGIGPAKALQARGVRAPLLVNEAVGSGIGDEVYVAVIFIAAEPQGAASGWSGLAGGGARRWRGQQLQASTKAPPNICCTGAMRLTRLIDAACRK